MKKVIFIIFLFIITETMSKRVFAQSSQYEQAVNTSTPQDTIHLFNGKSLAGWYIFIKDRGRNNDPANVFTVQNGVIHISGTEMGCITTNKEYNNYRLVVEYRWDKNDNNSETPSSLKGIARDGGVLLNSVGKDGAWNGIWMYSVEVNITEGGTGSFYAVGDGTDRYSITSHVAAKKQGDSYIYQPGSDHLGTIHSGRISWRGRDSSWKDVRGFRGKDDVEKPVGEWNRLECIVLGKEVSVFLNGILVNKAIDVSPSQGRIQIQSESAPMLIRRVDLIPLAPHSSINKS